MLSVARNTIVSHCKGLQKQGERRVTISENTETISEKNGSELGGVLNSKSINKLGLSAITPQNGPLLALKREKIPI